VPRTITVNKTLSANRASGRRVLRFMPRPDEWALPIDACEPYEGPCGEVLELEADGPRDLIERHLGPPD
jgi:hypothetical protein